MIKSKDLAAIKDGSITVDALLEAYPVKALVSDLVELLKNTNAVSEKPIVIDDVDWQRIKNLFKIRGFNPVTGLAENRGRKPKDNGEKLIKKD